jgi:glycosyltransferase involved in cell wall biosynthesis
MEECRKDGWDKLEIWSRGVDTGRFHPEVDREALLLQAGLPSSKFVVLYAGRMAPEKQTEVAVEAVSLFASRTGMDVELIVAGDGPAASEIKALTLRRGVSTQFLGAISQERLQQWMAASDVLLFPSATETFGNVVLEAMACGLPVVGAAGGAVPDTIRDGENGLLCAPGDADAFAGKLELLHGDPSLRARLSAAGVLEAKERSWDEVFRRLQLSIKYSIEESAKTFFATN